MSTPASSSQSLALKEAHEKKLSELVRRFPDVADAYRQLENVPALHGAGAMDASKRWSDMMAALTHHGVAAGEAWDLTTIAVSQAVRDKTAPE